MDHLVWQKDVQKEIEDTGFISLYILISLYIFISYKVKSVFSAQKINGCKASFCCFSITNFVSGGGTLALTRVLAQQVLL